MKRCSKRDAALLVGPCVVATLFLLAGSRDGDDDDRLAWTEIMLRAGRRELSSDVDAGDLVESSDDVLPWAASNLKSLSEPPDPAAEVPLFWTIPKSGSTEAKKVYECFGLAVATRAGALERFGHGEDEEVLAFRPWGEGGALVVNVDSTREEGILRAERMGLVASGVPDVIFTSLPGFAAEHLYDGEHRGRGLALFRHPIDRLVSKFYYLQVADWEANYSPQWAKMSVDRWARYVNADNNNYVRSLTGHGGILKEKHLRQAVETLRVKFAVGLTDRMEESVRRFNVLMGIDTSPGGRGAACMDRFFGEGAERRNSNSHPKVEEGSNAWNVLAKKNQWDLRLWDHILRLFDEQREIIDSYARTDAVVSRE